MEVILLLFLLLLLPLSLYIVSIIRRKGSDDRENLPPGSTGWPILGESIKFALSPEKFVKYRMEKYSREVFQTSILGEKMAIFCGAKGNKFLFSNEKRLLTSWMPLSLRKVLMSPESLDTESNQDSACKRVLHDVLSPEALKKYVPAMDTLARAHLDRDWNPDSVVRVLPLSKKYTFELACRLFLSEVDPVRVKRLSDPFTTVIKGLFSVPIDLPGTVYNRAIKGGKMVREDLMRTIEKRRKELAEKGEGGGDGRDMLSKMLLATDEDGQFLSEKNISNNIFGLLVASYDTTSSAITAVLNYLAQLPHIYDEVFKEQMAIAKTKAPGDLLTWEDMEKMKYSWNVARESLRIMPPAPGSPRLTTTEFTYAGFTIPKGWKTFWTVHSSHKNPDYFPEPEKFDPSRFEGSGPAPYTFVPFGGGPRMCLGREYAKLEMLVLMHNVVTRFKLEKAISNEKMVFHASPAPVDGFRVHLHPHQE